MPCVITCCISGYMPGRGRCTEAACSCSPCHCYCCSPALQLQAAGHVAPPPLSPGNRSSRSHAIFTITLEQRRNASSSGGGAPPSSCSSAFAAASGAEEDEDDELSPLAAEESSCFDDYLCAKMHLVDLAGSERAKRTKVCWSGEEPGGE